MKKALSLFLAFVMVALMIPFSAFITSATGETGTVTDGHSSWVWDFTKLEHDDGSDQVIADKLPEGWTATTDTETTQVTKIDENGIYLGGQQIGIALTADADLPTEIVNSTTDYVITTVWNVTTKIQYFAFSFCKNDPASDTLIQTPQLRFKYYGGPTASYGGNKFAFANNGTTPTDAGYVTYHNNTVVSSTVKDESGNALTQAQIIDTFVDPAIAGRDFSVSIEVKSGKVANVYITADGKTITYPVDALTITLNDCARYLSIWHNGWGTGQGAYVKSVKIEKGTYGSQTNFNYSQDFTALKADNGTDGDINSSLPTGIVASKDTESTWYTSISANGVTLGGAGQGLGLTPTSNIPQSIVDGNTDHVVTVKWNTTHKFNQLRFGWSYDYTSSKIWADNQLAFDYSGGPERGSDGTNSLGDTIASFTSTGDQQANFGTAINATKADESLSDWCTTTTNAAGTALDADGRYYMLQAPAMTGADFVTSFVIEGGKVAKIYLTAGGETIIYTPNSDFNVSGYFGVCLIGWAGNNTANIKSIEITTNDYVAPTESANIIHNYNIANAVDIDAIPYDICEEDGYGTITLNNGVLWNETTVAEEISYNNMIKVDGDLYGNLGDYTVDFTLAGGSEARIFYLAFGLNDDRNSVSSNSATNNKPWGYNFVDGNAFKLRIRADQDWESDNCSIWAYDASANKYIQANSDNYTRLSTNLSNAIAAGNDISFRAVVENNYLVCVYVSAGGYTIKATPRYRIAAPAGDIGFLQQSNDKFGLKSVTIYDAPIYNATVSGAEMAAPAGKAVVKVAGEATVINAGTVTAADYLTNALAVKTNGVYAPVIDTFTATAGKVYALSADASAAMDVVEAMKLTKGDTSLRLGSNPGIRYTSMFNGNDFDYIMMLFNREIAVELEMGTLITVDSHRSNLDGDMTFDTLDAYQAAKRAETGNDNYTVYLNVTGDTTSLYGDNTFAGSVIGVQSFTKNYVAVGYVKVIFSETEAVTIYTTADSSTSVVTLAQEIIGDMNEDEFRAADVEFEGDLLTENEKTVVWYLANYTEA